MLINIQKRVLLRIIFLFFLSAHAKGVTINEVVEHLTNIASTNAQIQWVLDVHYDPPSSELQITSLGPTLLKTVLNINNSAHPKNVERYSTNGYSSYELGGASGGRRLLNEGRIRKAQPVTGFALFASPFYQAKLIASLSNPTITAVDYKSEPAYAIQGKTILFNIPIDLELVIAQRDWLLMEEDLTMLPKAEQTLKIKALRKPNSAVEDWPYETVYSELWNGNRISTKTVYLIAATRRVVTSNEQIPELTIPDHTLVADDQDQTNYFTGPKYTKAEIKKFKTQGEINIHPGFVTVVRVMLICIFLLPLLLMLWAVLRKKYLNKK